MQLKKCPPNEQKDRKNRRERTKPESPISNSGMYHKKRREKTKGVIIKALM